ncbi:probable long-chain-alcohol O-fatty-acyltransferase 1 [Ricinus communis]|uniref:Acyltransferase, putative n=1 Tax=Ricinus communis TaxID=3988 RepID=B9SSQ4_RICCO|nr:probable long-chain-alcohol O-fatty-acyltransferase 1 [Ricinus communis]EEF33334.1 acyltransferase, putative [Ricinus communis]|eukprot:XP_002529023.1 probable long-chain-alcohol O-fatty-acyltransferase 1 [Ricinus communis]
MEGEFKNFIKVWILATTCLCYCYYVASKIPKGVFRLISLLPIFYLFIILPLVLTSFHLGAPTTFFLIWLANFKLLLFSFDQGPLSPASLKLFHFISLTYLPIKLRQNNDPSHTQKHQTAYTTSAPFLPRRVVLPLKVLLVALLFHCYSYKQFLHPYLILALYCLHMYLELEIILAISATPARVLFGFELEPQFNEPYLATSLQDFWGRRWNLMVTSILHPTVYYPVRQFFMGLIGQTWASLPAFVATFVVSGLMHEIIYFYVTRVSPTWEVTWFFIVHGVCVVIEVALKKMAKGRWELDRAISIPLTVVFVGVTAVWLFFPQLTRNRIDDKAIGEYSIFVNLLKQELMCFLSYFFNGIQ